jgi:hypothetical protein
MGVVLELPLLVAQCEIHRSPFDLAATVGPVSVI